MLHFSAPGFPPIKIIFPRTLLLCRVSNKMFNCLAFNRFERRNKDCNLGLLLTSKLLSWFYSQTKYSRLLFLPISKLFNWLLVQSNLVSSGFLLTSIVVSLFPPISKVFSFGLLFTSKLLS